MVLDTFWYFLKLSESFFTRCSRSKTWYNRTDVLLIGIESSAHITNNPLDFLNSAVRSEQHVNGVTGGVGGGGGGSGGGSGGGGGGSLTFSSPTSTMRLNDQNAVTSQVRHIHREQFIINSPAAGYQWIIFIFIFSSIQFHFFSFLFFSSLVYNFNMHAHNLFLLTWCIHLTSSFDLINVELLNVFDRTKWFMLSWRWLASSTGATRRCKR